jgi:hypothetical protein
MTDATSPPTAARSVVAIPATFSPRSAARWRSTRTCISGFDFSRLVSTSATPGIAFIARIRSCEIRSSSSTSGPRTLIWIGFWPKGPASKKPKVRPGIVSTARRASPSTSLKVLPSALRSFT